MSGAEAEVFGLGVVVDGVIPGSIVSRGRGKARPYEI